MTSGTIAIRNGELSYELRGTGEPVILLHGGALNGRLWDHEMDWLSERNTVVRYDARGHGSSSEPSEPFTMHDDLRELLDALDFPQATLVGLSMGSRVSIDFALAYPGRVEALFLTSPGISGMTLGDPGVLALEKQLAEAGAAQDFALALEYLARLWIDGPNRTPGEVDPAVRAACRRMMIETYTQHSRENQLLVTELDGVNRVPELRSRILTVVGEADSSDIHAVADLLVDQAANATKIVVPGAGHNVNLERPEEFRRLLTDFLG